ncbi:hypothetical protein [Ferrovibrio sp.]|uniref:hypothetical protein n=1 Tax=Ferrovibrio sp. TaxID=1917215 RepID=UPI00261FD4BD|nr:hypothetical protein [Ferrovibrio sp.]
MCQRCEMQPDVDLLALSGQIGTPDWRRQYKQQRILDLLALIEHPEAMPPGDALRVGQEILALLDEIGGGAEADALLSGLPRLRSGNAPAFKEYK